MASLQIPFKHKIVTFVCIISLGAIFPSVCFGCSGKYIYFLYLSFAVFFFTLVISLPNRFCMEQFKNLPRLKLSALSPGSWPENASPMGINISLFHKHFGCVWKKLYFADSIFTSLMKHFQDAIYIYIFLCPFSFCIISLTIGFVFSSLNKYKLRLLR